LSAAGKIIQGIKYNNIKDPNNYTDPEFDLTKPFQNSSLNIKVKTTSTKEA
jgi:hypothetical protein